VWARVAPVVGPVNAATAASAAATAATTTATGAPRASTGPDIARNANELSPRHMRDTHRSLHRWRAPDAYDAPIVRRAKQVR